MILERLPIFRIRRCQNGSRSAAARYRTTATGGASHSISWAVKSSIARARFKSCWNKTTPKPVSRVGNTAPLRVLSPKATPYAELRGEQLLSPGSVSGKKQPSRTASQVVKFIASLNSRSTYSLFRFQPMTQRYAKILDASIKSDMAKVEAVFG